MNGDQELTMFLEEKVKDRPETRMFVTLTVRQIPGELFEEFARKVVKHYEGGISEAIKVLMQKEILARRDEQTSIC